MSTDAVGLETLLGVVSSSEDLESNVERLRRLGGCEGMITRVMRIPCADAATHVANGLEPTEIEAKRAAFGANSLPVKPLKSWLNFFFEVFRDDHTIWILMGSALVSLAVDLRGNLASGWVEGAAVLVAVLLVGVVTAANNFSVQAQFAMLSAEAQDVLVRVIRYGGSPQRMKASTLVVGDILVLEIGDRVPCDCVMVSGTGVKVNESSLTGDAYPVVKQAATQDALVASTRRVASAIGGSASRFDPFLFAGSTLQGGSCTAVAFCVGARTQLGRKLASTQRQPEEVPKTPLAIRLETLAEKIGEVGVVFAALIFVASIAIFMLAPPTPDLTAAISAATSAAAAASKGSTGSDRIAGDTCEAGDEECRNASVAAAAATAAAAAEAGVQSAALWKVALEALVLAVTVVVVAVPEGLSLAVTISLAYSAQAMLADHNLVRHVGACETMGHVTAICADKTGTLTSNSMTVVAATGGRAMSKNYDKNAADNSSVSIQEFIEALPSGPRPRYLSSATAHFSVLATGIALNSTASIGRDHSGAALVAGSITEGALLVMLRDWAGEDFQKVREAMLPAVAARRLFDSGAKFTSVLVVHRDPATGQVLSGAVYTKGASEIVLSRCAFLHADDEQEDKEQDQGQEGGDQQEGGGDYNGSPGSNRSNRSNRSNGSKTSKQDQLSLTPLSTSDRRRLEAVIHKYAARAQRTLALGHKQLSARETTTLLQKYCAQAPSSANGEDNEGGKVGSPYKTSPSSKTNSPTKSSPAKSGSGGGGRTGGRSVSLGGGEALLAMSSADWDEVDVGLTLDLIVGIQDPLRPGAPQAVSNCQRAGVTVRMVTGDHPVTAAAVARNAGILSLNAAATASSSSCAAANGIGSSSSGGSGSDSDAPAVMTGPYFRTKYQAAIEAVRASSTQDKCCELLTCSVQNDLKNLRVLARASPADKLALVHVLKAMGEVVAITGDSINDAPALEAAHVGLAMNLCGSDVAKDAADMIIMNDDFGSIVNAVKWGRGIFDNVQRFLQFHLTVNAVALLVTSGGVLMADNKSHGKPPFNPVLLLWVNLIMDTLGALALATEIPSDALLHRKPYRPNSPLLSGAMWRHIIVQASLQLTLLAIATSAKGSSWMSGAPQGTSAFVHVWGSSSGGGGSGSGPGDEEACSQDVHRNTLTFAVFVACQVFNELNARSIDDHPNILRQLHQNKWFMGILAFTAAMQYALVTFGGNFTQTCPLTLREWATTTLLGAMSLPVGVLMRFMPKPFDNDEDEDNSDGASSGGTGSSLLPREGLQGANAAGEINESGTYEAFPTAAAALSSSAGNFKHVMSSEQRMKKERWEWIIMFTATVVPAWGFFALFAFATAP